MFANEAMLEVLSLFAVVLLLQVKYRLSVRLG